MLIKVNPCWLRAVFRSWMVIPPETWMTFDASFGVLEKGGAAMSGVLRENHSGTTDAIVGFLLAENNSALSALQ